MNFVALTKFSRSIKKYFPNSKQANLQEEKLCEEKDHVKKKKDASEYIQSVFPFLIQKPSTTETSIGEQESLLQV